MTRAKLSMSAWSKTRLAKASGLHWSTISRILSSDPKQRRSLIRLETLQSLQFGLKRLTKHTYSLEEIAAAIKAQTAAEGVGDDAA